MFVGVIMITDIFSYNNNTLQSTVYNNTLFTLQLFFHMLVLKALTQLNVTDHYVGDLNVSMNQYH